MNICSQCGASILGSVHICFLNTTATAPNINTITMGSYAASSRWLLPPSQAFAATIPQQLIVEADAPRLYTPEQVVALLDRIVPALMQLDDMRDDSERAVGYAKAVYDASVVIADLKAEVEGHEREPGPGSDDGTDE